MRSRGNITHLLALLLGCGGVTAREPAEPDGGVSSLPQTIAAGSSFACAVSADGVRCWGCGAPSLGDGPFPDVNCSLRPTLIAGTAQARTVVIGALHACALKDGAVMCWGDNSKCQLARADSPSAPVVSIIPFAETPIQLATGDDVVCAVTPHGELACWGDNKLRWAPVLESEPAAPERICSPRVLPSPKNSAVLAMSGQHACSLARNGVLSCWLSGDVCIQDLAALPAPASRIAVGPCHGCVIVADGRVECWGQGPGVAGSPFVDGVANATGVSAGPQNSCAWSGDGQALCWGANQAGELATPPSANSTKALRVPLLGVKEVAIGAKFACARLNDGSVDCWGDNTSGQLGDGTTTGRWMPSSTQ
jgi:alpha-tubulin suppressor-like RCC1 family protein